MTLRFSASARPASTVAATDLPLRAQQLLAADDLDGYRRLFGRIDSIEDPHRPLLGGRERDRAGTRRERERPRRAAAGAAGGAGGERPGGARARAERAAAAADAGVILNELWSLDAAEAMLGAAKRLDPHLEELDRSLTELAARRRHERGSEGRAPRRAALPELSRRAQEIAALAQPAEGLRLSLCMIVRDEQEMLPRCLGAVAEAVDEIVIVDTGSTDATIEIARSFGALVIEREWSGSFAEARNVSFDAARGDWLMYLDADEVLVREDAALLRSLSGRTWREAFYLSETNYTGELAAGSAVTHDALRDLPQPPRVPLRGAAARADRPPPARVPARAHRGDGRADRALSATSGSCAPVARSRGVTSACCACSRRKLRRARSCTTTSAASTPPRATRRRRWSSSNVRGSCSGSRRSRQRTLPPAL